MLSIINDLCPFFEDCYRRINVREYARMKDISPPTASKKLSEFKKERLLNMEQFKNYNLYYANKSSKDFIDLSRIYWRKKIEPFTHQFENVILFGSLAKAEARKESDIDLAIIGKERKVETRRMEEELKKQVQLFFFESINEIKNKELANNILNGYTIKGRKR